MPCDVPSEPASTFGQKFAIGPFPALTRSSDGVVINDPNNTTWTTYGSPTYTTDFVGLGYAQPQVFNAVVMDLGWQFWDGGDWSAQPRVFIQKSAADTNQKQPENDTANWVEVPGVLMSGNIFDGEFVATRSQRLDGTITRPFTIWPGEPCRRASPRAGRHPRHRREARSR